jgi:hypothetical protein
VLLVSGKPSAEQSAKLEELVRQAQLNRTRYKLYNTLRADGLLGNDGEVKTEASFFELLRATQKGLGFDSK